MVPEIPVMSGPRHHYSSKISEISDGFGISGGGDALKQRRAFGIPTARILSRLTSALRGLALNVQESISKRTF